MDVNHVSPKPDGNIIMLKEDKNVPITVTWENITVHTPNSKESLTGKIMFCKKEVPSKQIIQNGLLSQNCEK